KLHPGRRNFAQFLSAKKGALLAPRTPCPPPGGRPQRRPPLGREAAPRPGTRRFRAPPAARLRIPSYPLPIEAAIIGRRDQGGSRLAALEAPAPRSRPAGPVPPRQIGRAHV